MRGLSAPELRQRSQIKSTARVPVFGSRAALLSNSTVVIHRTALFMTAHTARTIDAASDSLLRCVGDFKQFNIKDKRCLCWDRTASTLAVRKHVRNDQLALATNLHGANAFGPSWDDS